MKTKHLIAKLLSAFLGARRQGHTTAMMNGALNTEKAIVIVADHNQQRVFEHEFPGVKCLTLGQLDKLVGMTGPVLIDHHAVASVLSSAASAIEDREAKLRLASNDMKRLAGLIDDYLNANA